MEHLVFSLGKFGIKRKSQRKQHTGEGLGLAELWEVCKKEGREERERERKAVGVARNLERPRGSVGFIP